MAHHSGASSSTPEDMLDRNAYTGAPRDVKGNVHDRLFLTLSTWKPSKYSLTVEWINTLWHICPKEYNTAKGKNELFLCADNMDEPHEYNFE